MGATSVRGFDVAIVPADAGVDSPRLHSNGSRRAINVAICHADGLFVDAIRAVMDPGAFEVVATTRLDELFDVAGTADACLIDMRLEGARDALRRLSELFVGLRLVGLTDDNDGKHARAAFRAGATACITSSDGLDRLVAVLSSEQVDDARHRALDRGGLQRSHGGRDPRRLTAREAEVLAGLMDGENTKMLAKRLNVSQATARTHVQSVLTKLGVHTRLEAVALVDHRRLVSLLDVGLVDDVVDSTLNEASALARGA